MKFQAERVGNVYMLQNSEVAVSGLQLSLALEAAVVETIRDYYDFKLECSVLPQREIGTWRCLCTRRNSLSLLLYWRKFS